MIEVENVSVVLNDVQVLENVSFDVQPGEILGLVGPNGSGKTTLLRSIGGLLDPVTGQVRINGTAISSLSRRSVSRRVAVVPQTTTLSFGFSVREIIAMGRTPYHGRLGEHDPNGGSIVDEALERTATEHLADRNIHDVSGGERQRVLIARALAQDTPVMLLDEPTASLDIRHQIDTFDRVRETIDDGKAAIAAIHDLDLAARYCDRLLLLSNGTPVALGTPQEVLQSEPIMGAFETSVAIGENTVTGTPSVTPLSTRPDQNLHVAILGGAGSCRTIIRQLHADGFRVSVGIVREGHRDADLADALGIESVTAPAAGPLPVSSLDQMRSIVHRADVTVLSDLAVDALNSSILNIAAEGTPLVVVEDRPFDERNFGGPETFQQYNALRENGTIVSSDQVISAISVALDADESDDRSGRLTHLG